MQSPQSIHMGGKGKLKPSIEQYSLDSDWVELIKEARKLGLTINEVQAFLASSAQNEVQSCLVSPPQMESIDNGLKCNAST